MLDFNKPKPLKCKYELKHKILRALELAEDTLDYCQGDSWERECTKDDREKFAELLVQIRCDLLG